MKTITSDKTQQLETLIEQFQSFSSPLVSDAMGRTGGMRDIAPLYPGARILGRAFTVRCLPNDNLIIHYAVKYARPGEVLVISSDGHTGSSPWGALLSLSAKERGLAGVVLDGCSRDRAEIEAMGFPVFARGVVPQGTFKQCAGSVNIPISCAGVAVCPGDIIFADEDGVVVVPHQSVIEVLRLTRETANKEQEIRRRILNGEVMYDFLNLDEVLKKCEAATPCPDGDGDGSGRKQRA